MALTAEQRRLLFRYDRDLPLDAHTTLVSEESGVRIERFSFASTHGHQVPAVLYRPIDARVRPPVLVIGHGAGSSKDDPVMRGLFLHWAEQGFACVGIDAPFHGERTAQIIDPTAILMRPFSGLHFGVQTAVDTMRLVDWVQTRSDLDAHRIGYAGFSMGTILGVQFVAVDPRVRAAVFALGGAGLLHYFAGMVPAERRHDYDLVAEALDPMHYAPLIAPRPVLMVNGSKDTVIPAPLGYALYNSLREPRRIIWYDGGHGDIPHEQIHAMRAFFLEHLRPD
ncbi:MAG: alpha/beta hydrolase [Dehalococcoidia bacterium]